MESLHIKEFQLFYYLIRSQNQHQKSLQYSQDQYKREYYVGSAIGTETYFLFLGYTYIKRLNILENYVKIDVRLGD